MTDMTLIAIVTVLVLLEYLFFGVMVARARVQAGVKAPATVGDLHFERYFRVQQNTLEQLIVFLPSLWLFGYYVHAPAGALLGLVFIAGRFFYYRGYVQVASKRSNGFLIGAIAQVALLLGGLAGAVVAWLTGPAA